MARTAEGWQLRPRGPHGILSVRFRHEAGRPERSTGTSDPRAAAEKAKEIYAAIVSGRAPKKRRVAAGALDEVAAEWIALGLDGTHAENTKELYELHMSTHLIPFFETLTAMLMTGKIADYGRKRLKQVTRSTVRKERNTLRTFLGWCKEQGIISDMPEWPPLPKSAPGVRATTRKAEAVDISPEQAAAFLAELPEWSPGKKGGSRRFAVRARYIFAWETGLRPSTIDKLRVPEHWKTGSGELVIEDRIDKARFGRTVPLTARAVAALEAVAPAAGLVFGKHDYRDFVAAAAKAANMPAGFAPYDLRHGRALELTEASGNLPGVAFLLGHKRLTTTDRYLKATRRAADAALAAAALSGASFGGTDKTTSAAPPSEDTAESRFNAGVRRAGLEPARCYPLAPQGIAEAIIATENAETSTRKSRRKGVPGAPIGGMPPELPGLAKGVALLSVWDALEHMVKEA